ncbi:MAG: hypothetical protein KJ571_01395 [Bacteroidetes bacterium]|nr:hypothetical protein [Bacteroidota bacterium]
MKTDIFNTAISSRNRLRFLYGLNEIELEPYYIAKNKTGKKVIFGRVNNSNEVKMFEYERIFNIKVLNNKFSPIIPILASLN